MSTELITIYTASSIQTAHMLKQLLESQGISPLIVNEHLQVARGELPLGWATQPHLIVPPEQAERARAIAVAFDRDLRTPAPETASAGLDQEMPLFDFDWPCCPSCDEPRGTNCPSCGRTGADFMLAYENEAAPEGPVLVVPTNQSPLRQLLCPDCDEVFPSVHQRYCPWCNHDFRDGVELPDPQEEERKAKERQSESEEFTEVITPQMLFVSVVLVLLVLGGLAYFLLVL